jgi:8-oxo-dGTP pyrophosphatase MutT (NUDIX family)
MENPEVIPGVLLFFRRKNGGTNEYAFHLRRSGFNADMYCVPGGHNNGLETYQECAIRESDEEVGIKLGEKDLKPVHLIYRKGNKRDGADGFAIRPDMCFIIEDWEGELKNKEPEKHGDIEWYPSNNIPENTVDYARQALEQIENGVILSNHGF